MKLLRRLVAIVTEEESYVDDIRRFVPENEIYTQKEEQEIKKHTYFYKLDPEIYAASAS